MTTLGASIRDLEGFESILKDIDLERLAEAVTPAQILSPVQSSVFSTLTDGLLRLLCGNCNLSVYDHLVAAIVGIALCSGATFKSYTGAPASVYIAMVVLFSVRYQLTTLPLWWLKDYRPSQAKVIAKYQTYEKLYYVSFYCTSCSICMVHLYSRSVDWDQQILPWSIGLLFLSTGNPWRRLFHAPEKSATNLFPSTPWPAEGWPGNRNGINRLLCQRQHHL